MKKNGLWFLLGACAAGIGIAFYEAVSEAVSVRIIEDFNDHENFGTEPEASEKTGDDLKEKDSDDFDKASDLTDNSDTDI